MEEDIQLGDEGGPSPPLDHGAQKARGLLAHQGSLGKRRRPSRGSLHTFLTSVSWNASADDATSDGGDRQMSKTFVSLGDANVGPKSTKVHITAPKKPAARSRSLNVAEDLTSAQVVPRVTTVHIKGRPASCTAVLKAPPSPRTHRITVDVETSTKLHRRDPSLDSGCGLDHSCSDAAPDSASSGKGSPDPGLAQTRSAQYEETLSPPAEFADSLPATPRLQRQDSTGHDRRIRSTPNSCPEANRSKADHSTGVATNSAEIRVNFRILPRASAAAPRGDALVATSEAVSSAAASQPTRHPSAPVVRSESLRVGGLQTWDSRRAPRLDAERRCRSLSRATGVTADEAGEQPEWMRIALQKQKSHVDWENFEAHMKEPHSISCTNLSESHMRDRVTVQGPPGPKPLLTRSVSAVYPRIKMSRFERRMRREARNPSPERKLSDDFNIVSDSTLSSGTASSSTEDEKPSFLNVQLRHVEKTPPLNVVYQTSRAPGEGTASPTLLRRSLKSVAGGDKLQRGVNGAAGSGAKGVYQEGGTAADKPRSQVPRGPDFLQPKPVELVEDTRQDTTAAANVRSPQSRSPALLRRSSSVQMRTKVPESSITRRSSPWPKHEYMPDGDVPSWIQEAERKRNSGIDWDRLDQSLSHAANYSAASMSTECLHRPVGEADLPEWLRTVRQRREDKQAKTYKPSEEASREDHISFHASETSQVGGTAQNGHTHATEDGPRNTGKTSSVTVETVVETGPQGNTVGKDILKTLHTSTNKALSEQGDHTPRIVDVQPKEHAKASRHTTAESCAKLLDEIFSEAEGTEDEQPTKDRNKAGARAESNESEDSSDSEKHTRKQALMLELKCVLKKRTPPEPLPGDRATTSAPIVPNSNVLQTETTQKQLTRSSPQQNGIAPSENTYLKPSEVRAFSFPPPPPVLPADLNENIQQQEQQPEITSQAASGSGPRRDSETQTADNTPIPNGLSSQHIQENISTIAPAMLNQGTLLHPANSTAVAYGHQLVSSSAGQVLILDNSGMLRTQQSVSLYTVPVCHPIYSQRSTAPSQVGAYPHDICLVSTADDSEASCVHSLPSRDRSGTARPEKVLNDGDVSLESAVKPRPCSPASEKQGTGETNLLNGHSKELGDHAKASEVSGEHLQQSPSYCETQRMLHGTDDEWLDPRKETAPSEASNTMLREQKKAVSSIMEALIPYVDADDMSEAGSVMPSEGFESAPEKHLVYGRRSQNNNAASLLSSPNGMVNGVAREETRELASPTSHKGREEHSELTSPVSSDSGKDDSNFSVELTDEASAEQPSELLVGHRETKRQNGVTLVSSTSTIPRIRLQSISSLKENRHEQTRHRESSTVTTGPDGTVRGNHSKPGICTMVADSTTSRGEFYSPFKKTKSYSVPNLLSASDAPKQRKKTVSASTQTPNGILSKEHDSVIKDETGTGKTRGVQTDVGSKLKVKRSARDVEVVTKVDSSSPSKTLRKKITTKIVRGSNGKAGGVREVVEEYYDQSSVTVRPFGASKGVTRCVRQASDGRKYLTTVITDAPAETSSSRQRRSHRRDKDHDGRVIMV